MSAIKHRNFWPYLLGTLASTCGTWFHTLALALFVYDVTDSTFLVGVAGFAQFAGTMLLAPWTGAVADRFDRRHVMIATQVGSILVTGLLALLVGAGVEDMRVVIGLTLVLGLVGAFSTPAMLTLVPQLVPEEDMRSGIALNAAVHNVSRAIGPFIGAVVVDHFGVAWAFGLNSLSYVSLIVALLVVHPREAHEPPAERPRFTESLRLVRSDPTLLLLILAIATVGIVQDPVTTLTPELVTKHFDLEKTWTGALIGSFGTGAVLAAFSAGRIRDPFRTLTMSLSVLGLGIAGMSLAPGLGVAMPALVAAGFGMLTSTTTTTAAVQLGVAPHQRGRVMAIWSVAFVGTRPFASLLDGALASVGGVRFAGVVFAVPAFVVAAVLRRQVRRSDSSVVVGA